jgi:hypothetical protein
LTDSGDNREKKILKVDINVKTIYTGADPVQISISAAKMQVLCACSLTLQDDGKGSAEFIKWSRLSEGNHIERRPGDAPSSPHRLSTQVSA